MATALNERKQRWRVIGPSLDCEGALLNHDAQSMVLANSACRTCVLGMARVPVRLLAQILKTIALVDKWGQDARAPGQPSANGTDAGNEAQSVGSSSSVSSEPKQCDMKAVTEKGASGSSSSQAAAVTMKQTANGAAAKDI